MIRRLPLIDPPILGVGPDIYDVQYQNRLNNLQRMFYNRLTNVVNATLGRAGGQYIDMPNGLFYNDATQTFALANTAYEVVFNHTYLSNAVSIQDSSKVVVMTPGVYNFQYSGQISSGSSSHKDIYFWIRRNGQDIGYSTRAYTLSSNNDYHTADWNFNIDLLEGDHIAIVAAVSDVALRLAAVAAAVHPGVASSVMTVNYVSSLPDTLPVAP